MDVIYLLMSRIDYEGSEPALAFHNEADAKAWDEKATDWLNQKPTTPYTNDDESWDKYAIDYEEWEKSIPELSAVAFADSFYVTSIEIKP